jgi:hypothetical protein
MGDKLVSKYFSSIIFIALIIWRVSLSIKGKKPLCSNDFGLSSLKMLNRHLKY